MKHKTRVTYQDIQDESAMIATMVMGKPMTETLKLQIKLFLALRFKGDSFLKRGGGAHRIAEFNIVPTPSSSDYYDLDIAFYKST
jgi:hypothetical protein